MSDWVGEFNAEFDMMDAADRADEDYPPCEWEQCGIESVIAIVGEAGDIWLCRRHQEMWG